MLRFVETLVFQKVIDDLLTDDDIQKLQQELTYHPLKGDVIPGTGGLRKLRFALSNSTRGKRSGVRIVYYFQVSQDVILLVYAYKKGRQDNLTASEKRVLKSIVEDFDKE